MRPSLALALCVLCACGSSDDREPAASEPAPSPAAPAPAARCGAPETYEGGEILERDDGARVYYRVAGPSDAPPVLFLHGGPGYNAYGFERSAGPLLERSLRMIYVDQRGCGRSADGPPGLPLGMDPTIADLEALRARLRIPRWSVVAHSFGGVVALAYAARHGDAIDRLVMIESTADLSAALENQVRALSEASDEMAAIAAEERPAMDRLVDMYQTLGRAEAHRRLYWASDDAQRLGELADRVSRLGDCTRDAVLPSYRLAGWTETRPELMRPTGKPTLLIAGRRSRVIGEALAERTRDAWGAELVWMESSGHFPFVEEPEPFARAAIAFLRPE